MSTPADFIKHLLTLPADEQNTYATERFAEMGDEEKRNTLRELVDHLLAGVAHNDQAGVAKRAHESNLFEFFKEQEALLQELKDETYPPTLLREPDAEYIQARLKVAQFEGPLLTPIQLMQLHPATTEDIATKIFKALRLSVDTRTLSRDQVANLTLHLVQSLAKELRP